MTETRFADRWAAMRQRRLAYPQRDAALAMEATVPLAALLEAIDYLDATGVDQDILNWLHEDRPAIERGLGRPRNVPVRTFMALGLGHTFAGLKTSWKHLHHSLIASDWARPVRQQLGLLTDEYDAHRDQELDRRRRAFTYRSLVRTGEQIALTYDPRPLPAKEGPLVEEVKEIEAGRDPADVARKQQRADELQSKLLMGTYWMLPDAHREAWDGSLTADGTAVPIYGKFGSASRRRKRPDSLSPEANAGWHAKNHAIKDPTSFADNESTYGYDLHVAMMAGGGASAPVPPLVVAVRMDTPGYAPGLNLADALAPARAAGLPGGNVTVDLGYSQRKDVNFALPLLALAYGILQMFTPDQYGKILASHNGIIQVEGREYGPCLPDELRYATRDWHEGRIDDTTYQQRLERRQAYEVRRKSAADGTTSYTYRCPGHDAGHTVNCELKPKWFGVQPAGRKPLPLAIPPADSPPMICTNKVSVTVPADVFARYHSVLPFNTPEYLAEYKRLRSSMEGRNRYFKDDLIASIASPGTRRFRGWGKQLLAILLKLVKVNYRALENWQQDVDEGTYDPAPKTLGRPKNDPLAEYRRDGKAPPLRIIGPDWSRQSPAA